MTNSPAQDPAGWNHEGARPPPPDGDPPPCDPASSHGVAWVGRVAGPAAQRAGHPAAGRPPPGSIDVRVVVPLQIRQREAAHVAVESPLVLVRLARGRIKRQLEAP